MVTATSTRRSFADDVREIDESFAVLVARIDPDAVPLNEVTELWTALDTVERRAAATKFKLLLARRVEEAGRWKRAGHRSAAEQLAAKAEADLLDGDEVCEIVGLGPIPVSAARELLGDAVLELVITKAIDVLNVTHLGRSASVAQQVALWWKSAACTVLGCTRTQRLQNDDRYEWVKTKRTRVDELDPLCKHHHDLKTRDNWALIEDEGRRPMVPPEDPRHPRNRPHQRWERDGLHDFLTRSFTVGMGAGSRFCVRSSGVRNAYRGQM